jgi:surfeit locus 1 family protein
MPVPWWSRRLWGAHLIGVVLFIAACGLGYWQLSVWQDHRASAQIDLTRETPVALDDVFGHDDPFPAKGVGRPVIIDGTWLPDSTVYVSGREHDGTDGYWVVTSIAVGPAAEASTAPAIPVVRGWLPTIKDVPAAPTGAAAVTAWLQPGEGSLINDDDPTDDVLPQMRIADLIQRVDQDLYGGYAISQQPTSGLEAADLAQLPKTGAGEGLRNFLYALEWWFFGIFAIVIWWKYVQELRFPDADPEPEPGPGTDPEPDPQNGEVVPESEAAQASAVPSKP